MGPKIFFIEGNIASGKTTLVNLLGKYVKNSQVILEPLDVWLNLNDSSGKNILSYFYDDPKRYAYTFQSIAFISRTICMREIDNTKDYVFIERSVDSDKNVFAKNCYETGLLSEIEWKLYNLWFDKINTKQIENSITIYLKTSPNSCYERLLSRNRNEENTVSLEYLTQIHYQHEMWLKKDINVLDGESSFNCDPDVIKYMIEEIKNFK